MELLSRRNSLLISICFLLITSSADAESLTTTVKFKQEDLELTALREYQLFTLPDCDLTFKVGEPQLPVHLVRLCLPAGARVEDIEIISTQSRYLAGEFLIYPVQPPQILSKHQQTSFVKPKLTVYNSSDSYPEKIVEFAGYGYLGGYNIASFLVYPLQYLPSTRKILFHSEITFSIDYTLALQKTAGIRKRSPTAARFYEKVVASLVTNREGFLKSPTLVGVEPLPPEQEHRYIIITADSFVPSFQPLADWKRQKGLGAIIVPTSSIYADYSGVDNQEKIRNFIGFAHRNWGTIWVLLGGDTNVVPTRKAFAMDSEAGFAAEENNIPCDLYYSDLDGNWDANSNGIYGEVDDDVDLLPDVFVGRAAVDSPQEADAFVNKVLTYEKNPPLDYQLNILFAAEILWRHPFTDARIGKDFIDEEYIPARFDPITKLYQARGNENSSTVLEALNRGMNLINHDGHAWKSIMGVGDGYINSSNIDALTNHPRNGILLSIGCWPAAFDYDCIAEHFISNPNGGGVAFIGNSRYGWGSPGNPKYGYSDRYDQQFYRYLFQQNVYHVGATLAMAKTHYAPYSLQENVYRWCQYEINLLGDPELPIWTATPGVLTVEHPTQIPIGRSSFTITVTDGASPIHDALVCLAKGDEIYTSGHTDASGQITFSAAPTSPLGEIAITVTAQDYLPYEGKITVVAAGPYVAYSSYMIDDSAGNGDGVVNPGERIKMKVTLKNYGNQSAQNVVAVLSSSDPAVIVVDSTESFDNIAAGDSVISISGYSLTVDSTCVNGQVIYLSLNIALSTAEDHQWTNALGITVATPVVVYDHHQVKDFEYGDGDDVPEPGEKINFIVTLKNEGLAGATGVVATVETADPYISVLSDLVDFGDIPAQEMATALFLIQIARDCPQPRFPMMKLRISSREGDFSDAFVLTVGEAGFHDDMESGIGGWSTHGSLDLWHLTEYRSHSQSHSWYCGYKTQRRYEDSMDASLVSSPFYVGPEAFLSFWAWYDVAIYGVDGFYVEINDGSGWKVLDFIGSGGALNPILMGNDWMEYRYDLSNYRPGSSMQMRFRFVSDGFDHHEGVYIDDVEIGSKIGTVAEPVLPRKYVLLQNYPNPFNDKTTIRYQLSAVGSATSEVVRLEIFNILGQRITTLVNEKQSPGYYTFSWGGRNDAGEAVSSGIYFYRLKVAGLTTTRKMLLLR